MSEEEALQLVEEARELLSLRLNNLREVRGEAPDYPCTVCDGTGKTKLKMFSDDDECWKCNGSGRIAKTFPWIVTGIKYESEPLRPSVFNRDTTWVKVRPCAAECQGKTYLGWLLGDMARSQYSGLEKDGTLTVLMYRNPAIFVPDLGRVVYGMESWWGEITTPDDLRGITDADISNVWYVKALKDLGEPSEAEE